MVRRFRKVGMPVYSIEYKGGGECLWLLSATSDLNVTFLTSLCSSAM